MLWHSGQRCEVCHSATSATHSGAAQDARTNRKDCRQCGEQSRGIVLRNYRPNIDAHEGFPLGSNEHPNTTRWTRSDSRALEWSRAASSNRVEFAGARRAAGSQSPIVRRIRARASPLAAPRRGERRLVNTLWQTFQWHPWGRSSAAGVTAQARCAASAERAARPGHAAVGRCGGHLGTTPSAPADGGYRGPPGAPALRGPDLDGEKCHTLTLPANSRNSPADVSPRT